MTPQQKNIPALRFPEFDGEWGYKQLKEFAKVATGNTPPTNELDNYGSEYMFVSPTDLGDFVYVKRTEKNLSGKGFDMSRKFPKGSILFTCIGSTIGKIGIAIKELTSNQQINAILPGSKHNSEFIYYGLSKISSKIKLLAGIQAVPIINKTEFEKTKVAFTTLPEQHKIADFLSAVDERIQQLTRNKDLLEQYKKGVMQQLFSQQIRYKDEQGNDYPKWEEKTLGEVSIKYYQGVNTTAEKLNYHKKGYPILQAKHITNEIIDFEDVRYINGIDYEKYNSRYNPKINDILITNIGTLGKIVRVKNKVDYIIAWNIFLIRIDEAEVKSDYIEYQLKYISKNGFFERMSTGNATKFVNKTEILSMQLKIPSKAEQQKIADFLTGIDDKITIVNTQIEQTQLFKKGLLQQMFV